MEVLPRVAADRAVRLLRRLPTLVPPRVWAAVYRSFMGAWCTASRIQRRGLCLFGCRDFLGGALDRRGHYLTCPVLERFGRRRLRLRPPHNPADRTEAMLGISSWQTSDDEVARRALLLAAAYRVHCTFRRKPGELSGEEAVRRALEQALRDLSKGHCGACRAIDEAWTPPGAGAAGRSPA